MFTDSHSHIFKKYFEDINSILEKSKKNGITKIINNGTDLESNLEVIKLSKTYSGIIYPAVGFHPECLDSFKKEQLDVIEKNIDSIIAIGEIGLDYHYEGYDKEKQIDLFEAQLKLAEKFEKPVIVHTRDSLEDTIAILKKYPKVHGVVHCFTGSL